MSLYLIAHAMLDSASAKPSSPRIRRGVDDIRGSEREASLEVGSHQGGEKERWILLRPPSSLGTGRVPPWTREERAGWCQFKKGSGAMRLGKRGGRKSGMRC